MAPKKLVEDPPPAVVEYFDEETVDEDEEEEDDAVEAEVSKAKSVDLNDDELGGGRRGRKALCGCSESLASDFTVKPVISKPANEAVVPSKKTASAKPAATPNSGSKRPAETEPNPKNSKKKKRIWSEDDEITILKGIIEFKSKKGVAANSNMAPFLEFIKKDLQVDLSTDQLVEKLTDKIRRVKKKYQAGEDGEDPVFSKPHELKCLDLWKKIWGSEGNGIDSNAKGGKRKPPRKNNKVNNDTKEVQKNVGNGGVKADPDDFCSKYRCMNGSLRAGNCAPRSDLTRLVIGKMPSLIGSSKAKELEERWRVLQLIEMDLSVRKLDLMQEQTKLVLDSMKSSKD
ncbi:mediator-associated protein 1-like [Pyrus ussuriensis x Pyrus communis]|uniref:Mediator-associated protein 1-like n=1 Tax=Pyrus ussuriensis x Pyrus communis TaxID=2448454 RepID=A0A5N5GA44_9ROSA|nr:mediator-associated protein 1-like [Pyrus ussuriensis x Pyrus communis]